MYGEYPSLPHWLVWWLAVFRPLHHTHGLCRLNMICHFNLRSSDCNEYFNKKDLTGTVVHFCRVQSRFAETQFAETRFAETRFAKTLTLTLNPDFGEKGFGELRRHQPLTLISANRVSANQEDTFCSVVSVGEIMPLFWMLQKRQYSTWASSKKVFRHSVSWWSSSESRQAYTVWLCPSQWPRSWNTCSSTRTTTFSWRDLPSKATTHSRRRVAVSSSDNITSLGWMDNFTVNDMLPL